jgi:hypothetical protein
MPFSSLVATPSGAAAGAHAVRLAGDRRRAKPHIGVSAPQPVARGIRGTVDTGRATMRVVAWQ